MKGPNGKHIFGMVKVGERGQIVIPKEAREVFSIKPGDMLLMLGDEAQGLAIVKSEIMQKFAAGILASTIKPFTVEDDDESEAKPD